MESVIHLTQEIELDEKIYLNQDNKNLIIFNPLTKYSHKHNYFSNGSLICLANGFLFYSIKGLY